MGDLKRTKERLPAFPAVSGAINDITDRPYFT
jgi:hypothetical protein